ncbi:MAG: GmrSD restriction endonuclease domain-containing protein, partial [Gammaproteobacteria bacterium]
PYNRDEQSAFTYNRVNDLDGVFMLILSSCAQDDPDGEEKLCLLSKELDRAFALLQLQGAYDSNAFQEMLYKISADIREKETGTIRSKFNEYITKELAQRRLTETEKPFKYAYFKQTGISLNLRFKRYFFARVEEFLANNTGSEMRHSISDLVSKTGAKTGFHVEHILAHNDENLALFEGDEERFEQERNRLGGILLLKGKDNISSSNELYADKRGTYAGTLCWNETLTEDFYKTNKDMEKLKEKYNLDLMPIESFGPDEIEARQRLLFEIASIIWEADST